MNRRPTRERIIDACVVLATLPALGPLLRPGLWAAHDMFHHLFRVVELDRVLRGGVIYARWLPDLGFFYGYPVLNFYSPLTYYVILLWHWLGAGFITALKISYALSFLVGAWGMYRWAREVWSPWASLWVAIAYTYAPYHLANAYVRGALAEHWAQALAPWLFWLACRLAGPRPPRGGWWLLAGGIAALILTHNLSAFLLVPAVVVYAVLWRARTGPQRLSWPRWAGRFAASLSLAAALSAIYWLPAVLEVRWIRAGQVAFQVRDYVQYLAPEMAWLSPYWVYRYYPHQGVPFEHPFSRWQVGLVLVGLGIAAAAWRRLERPARGWLLISGLFLLATGVLMSRASASLWAHVRVLAFLQFPWRFQGLASLMVAAQAAAFAWVVERVWARGQRWRMAGATVVFLALWAGTSMPYLPSERLTWPGEAGEPVVEADLTAWGMAQYDFLNGLWAREYGDPWLMEYLPVTVNVPRESFWLPGTPSNETYAPPERVQLVRYCPTAFEVKVVAPRPTFLRWHQFWFPGWQATVDGKPVTVARSSQLGLVTVSIPPGEHRVRVWFGETPPRRWGRWLSVVGLGVLLVGLWRSGRRRLAMSLMVWLLLWGGLWAWQNAQVSSCRAPKPAWYEVGERVAFLGCTVRRPFHERVEITVYWLALRPVPEDWKSFVHLLDPSGRMVAQHDAYPGENFSPTTRWEVGEIVPDVHTVRLPKDNLSWARVRLGLYRFVNGVENLPWRSATGADAGTAWEGTCGQE